MYFLISTVEMLKTECPTERKDVFRHMWFSSPGQNSLYTLAGYKYAATFAFFSQPLHSLKIYEIYRYKDIFFFLFQQN